MPSNSPSMGEPIRIPDIVNVRNTCCKFSFAAWLGPSARDSSFIFPSTVFGASQQPGSQRNTPCRVGVEESPRIGPYDSIPWRIMRCSLGCAADKQTTPGLLHLQNFICQRFLLCAHCYLRQKPSCGHTYGPLPIPSLPCRFLSLLDSHSKCEMCLKHLNCNVSLVQATVEVAIGELCCNSGCVFASFCRLTIGFL